MESIYNIVKNDWVLAAISTKLNYVLQSSNVTNVPFIDSECVPLNNSTKVKLTSEVECFWSNVTEISKFTPPTTT